MRVNIILGLRDDAQALIKTRLQWNFTEENGGGPYTGPVPQRIARLFAFMRNMKSVQKLFRIDATGGRQWTAWNLNFDSRDFNLGQVKDEIDYAIETYPNHIKVLGAWDMDTGKHVRKANGTLVYPQHARLLEFVLDHVTHDVDGNETSRTAPTDLGTLPRLMGQEIREFI